MNVVQANRGAMSQNALQTKQIQAERCRCDGDAPNRPRAQ